MYEKEFHRISSMELHDLRLTSCVSGCVALCGADGIDCTGACRNLRGQTAAKMHQQCHHLALQREFRPHGASPTSASLAALVRACVRACVRTGGFMHLYACECMHASACLCVTVRGCACRHKSRVPAIITLCNAVQATTSRHTSRARGVKSANSARSRPAQA